MVETEIAEYHLKLLSVNVAALRDLALDELADGRGLNDCVLLLMDMSDAKTREIVENSMPDIDIDDCGDEDVIMLSVNPDSGIELARLAGLQKIVEDGLPEQNMSVLTFAQECILHFNIPLVPPNEGVS